MRVVCCLLVVLAAAGCGDESYRADIAGNTLPYYELRRDLDAALSSPWEKEGISLRVPHSFTEQPGPPSPTKEQRDDPDWEPPRDRRQPDYLRDQRLPGLKGAWKGPLPGEGERVGNRWLYVLDSRGLEDDPVEPGLDPDRFAYEVTDRFARAFNLPTPELERFKWMAFPQTPHPFAPSVRYQVPPTALLEELEGQSHQVELYVHQARGRTVILALVMPEGATSAPDLGGARDLMLQTLDVTSTAGGAAGTTPAAGGGPGF